MEFVAGIVIMLVALSVLIIVHEFGHFWVARIFGFQTPIFGFGLPFGPYWVLGNVGDTQIRFHALLLGGYVAIPELGDESAIQFESDEQPEVIDEDKHNVDNPYGVPLKPFRKFPIWQRALVAFAGPAFNMLFAWLVMFIVINTLGDPYQRVVVGGLPPENPIAAHAGVKSGDQIVSIDSTPVESTEDIIVYLGHHRSTPVTLHLMRDGKPVDLSMTTNANGKVGMELSTEGPMQYRKVNLNPIESVGFATRELTDLTSKMLQGMGMMFEGIGQNIVNSFNPEKPKVQSGKHQFGFKDLHGVLAVVKIGADIASRDWSQLPIFVVMISMDLAIINLVPWPGLDGSHLAFMLWEAVRGKPMEERKKGTIVQWGFISLLVLMAVIMYNDIEALVTGKLEPRSKKQQQQQNKPEPAPSSTPPGAAAPDATTPPADSSAPGATPSSSSNTGAPPAADSPTPANPTPATGSSAAPTSTAPANPAPAVEQSAPR